MLSVKNFNKGSRAACSPARLTIKSLIIGAVILTGIQAPLQAQEAPFTKPSWWFGAAAGANFNFYNGSTQNLNAGFTPPVAFHDGKGVGLYLAPLVEFHRPESRWGVMLQAGLDSRRGSFEEEITPCNCPANLSTDLSYITVEPSLRFAPFKSGFYLMGGPRLAFNVAKSFTYELGKNPEFPEQAATPEVKGDLSNVEKNLISMQIGAGYDIPLSSQYKQTQAVLSPFVSFQPYFGQSPRSTETWTMTTFRVGAALKFGRGRKNAVISDPQVQFSVNSPANIPADRRVRETFPLRNYVYFNLGSTDIPDRYVMLGQDQVKDFKADQLEVSAPVNPSGRSAREMTVYYNVLNILGDRMGKNPATTVTLVGSSEKGPADGKAMATSVKEYLTGIFGIDASRVSIEGRDKPKIPSEQPGGTLELGLLREGDRRVSIESSSPALLMEFQTGPGAPLKPVEMTVQEAPLDSYVSFNVAGANEAFSSWSLAVVDENGTAQNFGPYTQDSVSIPGKTILGNRPEGNYKVTMTGQTKSGETVKKDTSAHLVRWMPAKDEEGMRFSVIYEFNQSEAIDMYEKYITDIVTPKIPAGGTVSIHGHTDIIGDEANNQKLSLARANNVRKIIENSLTKAGRSDVKFEVDGFGEDQASSPFENKYPEERAYNRTVMIDIIPGK